MSLARRLRRHVRRVVLLFPKPAQRAVFSLLGPRGLLVRLWLGATYNRWIRLYDRLSEADCRAIEADIERLAARPLISVVIPVYNPPAAYLRTTLDSVLAQLYPNWEICIADDASTAAHIGPLLEEYASRFDRIRVVRRTSNGGISAATNSAIELASGEFVALLDHDDVLPRHALYMVAREHAMHPDADLIYSDEDKLDEKGRRYNAYFKSDWNPDLLLSQNTISHFGIYRTALVRAVGGLRSEYDGSQDWDLALRVARTTRAERIRHIPHVLYHWRAAAGSTARAIENKSYAIEAGRRAVQDHLRALPREAEVDLACGGTAVQVRYPLHVEPKVSVIIPTRDQAGLLARCVEGILHGTEYRNLEVLIVDNQSAEPATHEYFARIGTEPRVRILRYDKPFNFSLVNNFGVAETSGEIVLFLNNDTEVIAAEWLRALVSNAMRPEVGAVGAKLLYPDRRVQHAGVILGLGGVGHHVHLGYIGDDPGYFGRAVLQQNFSAVTAACMAMRRDVFIESGGFDPDLRIAFNDVDLCLKIRQHGYLIVWTPLALLYHHESVSRGSDLRRDRYPEFMRENELMLQRWGPALECDPYFNPNLDLWGATVNLAFPPRIQYPWRS